MEPNLLNTNFENAFFNLMPEDVLSSVEAGLGSVRTGVRATGRLFALNSIENRVYQVEMDDGKFVIVKFYRPSRWSAEQIQDEHRFLQKLHAAEIPVVPALELENSEKSQLVAGNTLAQATCGIYFAIFPRVVARGNDEPSVDQLTTLGRYIARIHSIGKSFGAVSRIKLNSKTYGEEPLAFLLSSSFMADNMKKRYESVARRMISTVAAKMQNTKTHLIHGDCHLGNVLWNGTQPFVLDFDDCLIGPPVQDIWMVIRGNEPEDDLRREKLIAGYEQMLEFDHSTLNLIEPLRGLRMLHYSAWVGKRWKDPSFPKMFPSFGTEGYWQDELERLERVAESQ